jgi:hypothetical protein
MATEFIPWFLLAASLATIFIAPLLSDGPPQYPTLPSGKMERTR